jgi:hypothetical protein
MFYVESASRDRVSRETVVLLLQCLLFSSLPPALCPFLHDVAPSLAASLLLTPSPPNSQPLSDGMVDVLFEILVGNIRLGELHVDRDVKVRMRGVYLFGCLGSVSDCDGLFVSLAGFPWRSGCDDARLFPC